MADLLPEDRIVSDLTDVAVEALNEVRTRGLPEGWRVASYEDLLAADLSDAEIDDIGPVVVGPDGRLHEVEVDVTLSVLRRATTEELAAAKAAITAFQVATS